MAHPTFGVIHRHYLLRAEGPTSAQPMATPWEQGISETAPYRGKSAKNRHGVHGQTYTPPALNTY